MRILLAHPSQKRVGERVAEPEVIGDIVLDFEVSGRGRCCEHLRKNYIGTRIDYESKQSRKQSINSYQQRRHRENGLRDTTRLDLHLNALVNTNKTAVVLVIITIESPRVSQTRIPVYNSLSTLPIVHFSVEFNMLLTISGISLISASTAARTFL